MAPAWACQVGRRTAGLMSPCGFIFKHVPQRQRHFACLHGMTCLCNCSHLGHMQQPYDLQSSSESASPVLKGSLHCAGHRSPTITMHTTTLVEKLKLTYTRNIQGTRPHDPSHAVLFSSAGISAFADKIKLTYTSRRRDISSIRRGSPSSNQ